MQFKNYGLEKFLPILMQEYSKVRNTNSIVTVDDLTLLVMSTDPTKESNRNMMFTYCDLNFNVLFDSKMNGAKIILYNIPQRNKIYIINVNKLKQFLAGFARTHSAKECAWQYWYKSSTNYSAKVDPIILEKVRCCKSVPDNSTNLRSEIEAVINFG